VTPAALACWLALAAMAANVPQAPLDAIFAPLATAKTPGFAVLVRQHGRTLFERGYGVRDLRTFAPIGGETDFRLASCTKQFTAMAIMLLVHDGKLRYDGRLSELLPGFPPYAQAITVRHLLTHTAGLPDYEDLMGSAWTASHQIQDDEVLRLLQHAPSPKFAAGTNWQYSNSAYVVLGLIAAKVSGEPFEQLLQNRIFGPLRMTHTLAFVNGRNTVPQRAYGHTRFGEQFRETDQSPTSATLGDGGVYSNLEDLAKWDDALRQYTLLGEDEMRAALTPASHSYGFGWYLDPLGTHRRMWHTGETEGFRTAIERFYDDHLTVIVLANRTDFDAGNLAVRTARVLLKP